MPIILYVYIEKHSDFLRLLTLPTLQFSFTLEPSEMHNFEIDVAWGFELGHLYIILDQSLAIQNIPQIKPRCVKDN